MSMNGRNGHYDIIGDIHGHAELLEALLLKLGYEYDRGVYRHPGRTAVFVGDLIDRGPQNFKVLEMVKPMVEEGFALIVMGNHEYNALCFHTRDSEGKFLRPHSAKNISQHKEVLAEIAGQGESRWEIYLEWFRRMPLFLELEGIRVVHACWDHESIDFVKNNNIRDNRGRLSDGFLVRSARPGTDAYAAIDALLKGLEIPLPPNHTGVYDRDGILRTDLRLKWWMNRHEREQVRTYDQAVRADGNALENILGLEIPGDILATIKTPGQNETGDSPPVFFGHYWFTGVPQLLGDTLACLDYSAARGGKLACYRWDGEHILNPAKFAWV